MRPWYLLLLVLEVPSPTLRQTALLPLASGEQYGLEMACNKHSQQVSTCVYATRNGKH